MQTNGCNKVVAGCVARDCMIEKGTVKMKSAKTFNQSGFTLVEIMVVIAIIGLLAAIALPNYVKARASSQATSCINNLRQIDTAAQQYALEEHKRNGQDINFPNDLTPYIKLNSNKSIPPCPAGGSYVCDIVGNSPTCTIGDTVTPPHILQ